MLYTYEASSSVVRVLTECCTYCTARLWALTRLALCHQ